MFVAVSAGLLTPITEAAGRKKNPTSKIDRPQVFEPPRVLVWELVT